MGLGVLRWVWVIPGGSPGWVWGPQGGSGIPRGVPRWVWGSLGRVWSALSGLWCPQGGPEGESDIPRVGLGVPKVGLGSVSPLTPTLAPQPARGRGRAANTRPWTRVTSTPSSTAPRSWATWTSSSPASRGEPGGWGGSGRGFWGAPAPLTPPCPPQGPLEEHLSPGPREAERVQDCERDHG